MPITNARRCRLILAIVLAMLPVAAQAQTIDAVRDAYADVDQILATGQRAQGWREYLLLDQWSEQLRKGAAADRAVVARIHARFVKGSEIVAYRAFSAARDALADWLKSLHAPGIEQLPRLARESASGLQRPSADDLRTQRAIAKRLIENLHAQIPPSDANDSWRKFLGIPNARSQLADGKQINPQLLEMISLRHAAMEPLWQDIGLAQSAAALRKTAELVRSANVSDDEYRRQIERLASALDAYAKKPNAADAAAVVDILAWLDQRGQAREAVAVIRPHFCRPNLLVRASRRLIGAGIDSSFDEEFDIDEMILGNRQFGSGRATGSVRLELLPDARRLALRLAVASTIISNTSTSQDSVSVSSESTAYVDASKDILFDQSGKTHFVPSVQVNSTSDILDISMGGRVLGRRAAERRVYEQKPASDAEAREKTRDQVGRQIDEQVSSLVDPIERYYLRSIRLPLLTNGNFPGTLRTRTTSGFVNIALAQANERQWSLSATPPPIGGAHDLSVRIHESFVANFAAGQWSGATVNEKLLHENLVKLFGRSPEGLKVADAERVWTVTFDQKKPLAAKFDKSAVTFELRIAGFTVGEKSYPGMWLSVRYKFAQTSQGFVATRQGRLEVVPPGFDPTAEQKLGARQQVLRSILRKRFERIFPAEWKADSIALAGNWQKAGALAVAKLSAEDGWLTMEFRLAPPTVRNPR